MRCFNKATCTSRNFHRHGVWVPAFAGTTLMERCCTAAHSRHRERSEAIHLVAERKNGLLRYARNDAVRVAIHFQKPVTRPLSRGRTCPRLAVRCPSKEEGAGNAGCTLHPRSRVQTCTRTRTRAYRAAEAIRHSLRNGSTAYFALTPGYRAFLPPSPAKNWLIRARSGRLAFRRLDADH
jgi:hypothetical protein